MATNPSCIKFREGKVNPDTKLYRATKKCAAALLHGKVLAVDPSIGSSSSQPGYAIYANGALTEYGTIEIRPSDSSHLRLYELGRSLREDFSSDLSDFDFDVLVIEDIPMVRYEGKGRTKGRSLEAQVPLHHSVGAIMSSVRVTNCVAVHPLTWHAFAPLDYVKSDAGDAVCLGHTAIAYARYIIREAITDGQATKRPRKT